MSCRSLLGFAGAALLVLGVLAAGEDPLSNNWVRFRNRYMCKYVWKPGRYNTMACTGCGRCTDACIGAIDKNELFIEVCQIIA